MLTALVVTQTFASDEEIQVDARIFGVGAAAVAIALRAPIIVAMAIAARRHRAASSRRLGATRGRPAVPEHGGGRDRLGDEAGEPDHEHPLSKVPHAASFRRMCQST